AEAKATGWRITTGDGTSRGYWIAISNCLRSRSTTDCACPVNSVGLHRIGAHFHQARFDHDLLGRLVDLHQHFPDVVDVAAGLAEENRVGAFVDLRRIFACKLGRNQRRNVLGPRVTELVAVAFSGLS